MVNPSQASASPCHPDPSKFTKTTKVYRRHGSGTREDPVVYWVVDPLGLDAAQFWRCTEIARQQAREWGMLAAVVRKENHNTERGRNPNTGRLTGNKVVADSHITLYLGNELDDLQLSGHAYTNQNKRGVPTGLMHPEDRTIVRPGRARCTTEYWVINNQPFHNLDLSLVQADTPQWSSGSRDFGSGGSGSRGHYLRTSTGSWRKEVANPMPIIVE